MEFIKHVRKGKTDVTVVGVAEGDELKLTVARCSKNDNFCKKTGRIIARHRQKKEQYFDVLHIGELSRMYFNGIAEAVAKKLQKNSEVVKPIFDLSPA